jgi:hypothetical protein
VSKPEACVVPIARDRRTADAPAARSSILLATITPMVKTPKVAPMNNPIPQLIIFIRFFRATRLTELGQVLIPIAFLCTLIGIFIGCGLTLYFFQACQ